MKNKKGQQTTIFLRIMFRLTVPLLFLTAVFTAIQLTNQINVMNQFYQLESSLTFEFVQKLATTALKDRMNLQNPLVLRRKLVETIPFQRNIGIQVLDVFNHSLLFQDAPEPWTPRDDEAVEKSLFEKQKGKTYYVRIDKKNKRLIAYIPSEGQTKTQLWITRVTFPLAHFEDAVSHSRGMLGITIPFIILTGIFIGRSLAKSIVKPIRSLNQAAKDIMAGNLGTKVKIQTGDELQSLAETFNEMSVSFLAIKESAADANPLTHLPGNQSIVLELQKRIHLKQKFVLFHTDLDRFKIFNDHYGLAKGDQAIIKTAEFLKAIMEAKEPHENFIGHQGGDDYILIVKQTDAKQIAETVVKRFSNEVVKSLYSKEDFEKGYTTAYDRRAMADTGEIEAKLARFPLLAISLAGVSNAKKDFANYQQCLKLATTAKKEAKKIIKSSYVIQE